jgi:formate-dependent nitrite reductase membrane component NrfD
MELESRSQKVWGWKIPVYLFLGGLGGGCYVVGILFDLFSSEAPLVSKVGVLLGPPTVLIGTLFLLADLERPGQAIRAVLRPSTSWISRGTIFLSVFIILGAIHIACWIWPYDWMSEAATLRKTLGAVNGIFALLTVIYTGLVLGALRPIPIWCNPMLPLLFLVSGLSTGLMAIGLGVALYSSVGRGGSYGIGTVLAPYDTVLILIEGLVVFFYLQGSHLLETSRNSIRQILRGDLALPFWLGFVLLGLALPIAVSLAQQSSIPSSAMASSLHALFVGVPGLVGGYMLRYVIVAGGIRIPMNVEGVMVSPLPET